MGKYDFIYGMERGPLNRNKGTCNPVYNLIYNEGRLSFTNGPLAQKTLSDIGVMLRDADVLTFSLRGANDIETIAELDLKTTVRGQQADLSRAKNSQDYSIANEALGALVLAKIKSCIADFNETFDL
jgi:hypothetical protein